jgi:hypothetical protein
MFYFYFLILFYLSIIYLFCFVLFYYIIYFFKFILCIYLFIFLVGCLRSLVDFHPHSKNVILASPCSGDSKNTRFCHYHLNTRKEQRTTTCLIRRSWIQILLCDGRGRHFHFYVKPPWSHSSGFNFFVLCQILADLAIHGETKHDISLFSFAAREKSACSIESSGVATASKADVKGTKTSQNKGSYHAWKWGVGTILVLSLTWILKHRLGKRQEWHYYCTSSNFIITTIPQECGSL